MTSWNWTFPRTSLTLSVAPTLVSSFSTAKVNQKPSFSYSFSIDPLTDLYSSHQSPHHKTYLPFSGKNIDGVLADPFMMLIPPIEQFAHEYIFATPDDERVKKEFDNYVTLVVKTEEKAG